MLRKALPSPLVLLLFLALACQKTEPPSPAPTVTPRPSATATPAHEASPPAGRPSLPQPALPPRDRNLYELTQQLRLLSDQPIPRIVNEQPVSLTEGAHKTFTLIDLRTNTPFTVDAILRRATDHAYFFFADSIRVSDSDLDRTAQVFESVIFPAVARYFGEPWTPGVDNDPHLYIVHARIPQVAGYYNASDEYPRIVNKLSNEIEVIYLNADAVRPGSNQYFGTLAHELQHAVHWASDPTEEVWVNEGLSELALEMAGYDSGLVGAFLINSNTPLTAWSEIPARTPPHYGAAMMFFRYLGHRYGGYDALKRLVQEPKDGIDGINAYVAALGFKESFDDVFRDWVVANIAGLANGSRYSYPDTRYQVRVSKSLSPGSSRTATVSQYAADYYELRPGDGAARIEFQGDATIRSLSTDPPSGRRFYRSALGDSIAASMTQAFDLTGLTTATLRFNTWFHLEEDFDFVYVQVSGDGGRTWDILPATSSTTTDKLGLRYGPSYTGRSGGESGPTWLQESVDLGSYAGRKVLVRFQYITDDAINTDGWAIDDIAIPELGFLDDAESDGGWLLEGFARSDNTLAQRYAVQLVETLSDGSVRVTPLPLDAANHVALNLLPDPARRRAVLAIAAMTDGTLLPAGYTVQMGQ